MILINIFYLISQTGKMKMNIVQSQNRREKSKLLRNTVENLQSESNLLRRLIVTGTRRNEDTEQPLQLILAQSSQR